MYKNYLKITTAADSMKILPDTSWQEKDILYKLLCDCVPTLVREIVPYNDMYLVTWRSEDDFRAVLSDKQYNTISSKLKEYSIFIDFLPI